VNEKYGPNRPLRAVDTNDSGILYSHVTARTPNSRADLQVAVLHVRAGEPARGLLGPAASEPGHASVARVVAPHAAAHSMRGGRGCK